MEIPTDVVVGTLALVSGLGAGGYGLVRRRNGKSQSHHHAGISERVAIVETSLQGIRSDNIEIKRDVREIKTLLLQHRNNK